MAFSPLTRQKENAKLKLLLLQNEGDRHKEMQMDIKVVQIQDNSK